MSDFHRHLGRIEGWLIANYAPPDLMISVEFLNGSRWEIRDLNHPETHSIKPRETTIIPDVDDKNVVNIPEPMIEAPEKRKNNAHWTPEMRAAAGERLRNRIAAGKMKRTEIVEANTHTVAVPAAKWPGPQDEDTDTLIEKHSDYVGQRTDATLVATDYGDIKRMRTNGMPDARIAKSYGVEMDYLQNFMRIEGAKSGNW